MPLNSRERAHLQVSILSAISEIDYLFRADQDMTYVVMCINRKHPDRHVMISELDFGQVRTYLDEIEANQDPARVDVAERGGGEKFVVADGEGR